MPQETINQAAETTFFADLIMFMTGCSGQIGVLKEASGRETTGNALIKTINQTLSADALVAKLLSVLINSHIVVYDFDNLAVEKQFRKAASDFIEALFALKKTPDVLKPYIEYVLLSFHLLWSLMVSLYTKNMKNNKEAIVILKELEKYRTVVARFVKDQAYLTTTQAQFLNIHYGQLLYIAKWADVYIFLMAFGGMDKSHLEHAKLLYLFLDRRGYETHFNNLAKEPNQKEYQFAGARLAHAVLGVYFCDVLYCNKKLLPLQCSSVAYVNAVNVVRETDVISQLVALEHYHLSLLKAEQEAPRHALRRDFLSEIVFKETLAGYKLFLEDTEMYVKGGAQQAGTPEIRSNVNHPLWQVLLNTYSFLHQLLTNKQQFYKDFSWFRAELYLPDTIEAFVSLPLLDQVKAYIEEMQALKTQRQLNEREFFNAVSREEQLRLEALRQKKLMAEEDAYEEKEEESEELPPTPPPKNDTEKSAITLLIKGKDFPQALAKSTALLKQAKVSNVKQDLMRANLCMADTYFGWQYHSIGKAKSVNQALAQRYYHECIKWLDELITQDNINDPHLVDLQSFIRDERLTPVSTKTTVVESHVSVEESFSYSMPVKKLPTPLLQSSKTTVAPTEWHFKLPDEVKHILMALRKKGYQAWLTGGAVRDYVLGMTPNDFDIVTTAPMNEIAGIIGRKGKLVCSHHPIFDLGDIQISGMITPTETLQPEKVILDNQREVKQHRTTDVKENIKSRDFTCNALYYDDMKKKIMDECNGLDAILKRHIVFIHPTATAITNDASLILRALRVCGGRGFKLTKSDTNTCKRLLPHLKLLNVNKFNHEMHKTLMTLYASQTLYLLRRLGVWTNVFAMTEPDAKRCDQALTALFAQDKLEAAYELCWSIILFDRLQSCVNIENYDLAVLANCHETFFKPIFETLGIQRRYTKLLGMIYLACHIQTNTEKPQKPAWLTEEAYQLGGELKRLLNLTMKVTPLATFGLFSKTDEPNPLTPPTNSVKTASKSCS